VAAPTFSYTSSGKGDPFGASAVRAENNGGAGRSAIDTTKKAIGLRLKGILWKDPPLVVLETIDGRTCIVKQGERINGFTLSSISKTEVTLTSPQGSHVLHQYQ
jgi:hypothetical protein